MKIYFFKSVSCPFTESKAKKIISLLFKKLKLKGDIELGVVGDETIKKINYEYRHKNSVTDVLSFAWQEDQKVKSDFLGQIYICYPQITRQAVEHGIPIGEEFSRMLIHGVLHLAGFDHQTSADEKKMFALQEEMVHKAIK